jgi:hypothetical protein
MKYKVSFLALTILFLSTLSAQEVKPFVKECTISSGYGYANGVENSKGGSSIFLQMDYQLSQKFSLATEFDNTVYKAPGYYSDLPISPNVQNLYDNYYSLLIKYHLPINSKLRTSLGSGWTFYTRQTEYWDYYKDPTGDRLTYRITSFSDFGIPFLLETSYPVWKNLSAGVRLKCNMNPLEGSTYSAGLGLSIEL